MFRDKFILLLFVCLMLVVNVGCQLAPKKPELPSTLVPSSFTGSSGGALALLSWVGAISTLAGIAALILTKGSMGLRAILAGIAMCIIAYAVSIYAHLIFIPIIITIGVVSVFYGGWTIYKTIQQRRNNKKC